MTMKTVVFMLLGLSAVSSDQVSLQEFTNANNLVFTPAVYKELLNSNEGNFLVSPFSAETVVAFAQSGCRGKTAEEIRKALSLPDDNDKIEEAIKSLLPIIKGNELYSLQTANKMYVKQGFPVKDKFKTTATKVFQADSENIDFTQKEEAAKTMNSWVENHTENKIHDLIKSDVLDEDTRLILINALYFKANWTQKFLLAETAKRNFYKSATDVIEVDNMQFYEEFVDYYECPHLNAKFLELSFQGGDASMTIILPNEKEGLADLEKQIDRVFVPHNLTRTLVNVAIPKFKIESEIDFKKVLQNLGVQEAFKDFEADLSGIYGKKGDLVISQIRQKTFIDVNEEGVEAAAASFVLIPVPDSALIGPLPKEFNADHPFIFYIKVKNVIIFAGRVTSPSL